MKNLKIKEAFDFSWKEFISAPLFYLGAASIFVVAPLVAGVIMMVLTLGSGFVFEPLAILFGVFTPIVLLLVSSLLKVGMINLSLKARRNEKLSFGDLLEKKKLTIHMLAGFVLYGLLVGIGTAFFVIPGIFFAVRFYFFDYFLTDEEIGPISALKKSFEATKGVGWEVLLFLIVLGLLSTVLTTTFFAPILLIVLWITIFYLSSAAVYEMIS